MIPQIRTTSDASGGNKSSSIANFSIFETPFNVGIGVAVTGTATYTIQHTFDDPQNIVTWFNHDDAALVAATANQDGNFAYPVTAAKILQTGGTGSVVATFIQAGRGLN